MTVRSYQYFNHCQSPICDSLQNVPVPIRLSPRPLHRINGLVYHLLHISRQRMVFRRLLHRRTSESGPQSRTSARSCDAVLLRLHGSHLYSSIVGNMQLWNVRDLARVDPGVANV